MAICVIFGNIVDDRYNKRDRGSVLRKTFFLCSFIVWFCEKQQMDLNLLNYCVKKETIELSNNVMPKIPRPPNAFMLYATDNRKVLSHKYPADSNKIISKKLGSNWKNLSEEEKNKYFDRARIIAIEHKEKYPENSKLIKLSLSFGVESLDVTVGLPDESLSIQDKLTRKYERIFSKLMYCFMIVALVVTFIPF